VAAELLECLIVSYIDLKQQQKLYVRAYAPFVLLFVKGLNATFKYFERKLSDDGR